MTLFPEANNWRDAMQDVSYAIEETMAEPVTVTPARSGGANFPAIPEPENAVNALAVFTRKATTALGSGKQYGGHTISPLVSTSEPVFQFRYGALPWPIKQGYRITLPRTGEVFEVTDVKPDGVSSTIVHVVQLGRQKDDTASVRPTPVPPNLLRP